MTGFVCPPSYSIGATTGISMRFVVARWARPLASILIASILGTLRKHRTSMYA
jgi:hypothetical protein